MNYFIDLDAVYHALLMIAGIVFLVIVAAALAFFLIGIVEGNGRRHVRYDENGMPRER